jgi:hypothetical protein
MQKKKKVFMWRILIEGDHKVKSKAIPVTGHEGP